MVIFIILGFFIVAMLLITIIYVYDGYKKIRELARPWDATVHPMPTTTGIEVYGVPRHSILITVTRNNEITTPSNNETKSSSNLHSNNVPDISSI